MKKVLFTVILFMSFTSVVLAAPSYNLSTSASSIENGGWVSATLTVYNVASWNIEMSSAGNTDGCYLREADATGDGNNTTKYFTVKCRANSIGIISFVVSGDVTSSDKKTININDSRRVTVTKPREKSSNNNLKSLSVEGYEITPKFDKDTLEYTVSVPATVEKVKINAEKADGYASLEGTGEVEVIEGKNEFEVVVTSETGVAKKYKVNVMVEDKNPIEVKVDGKTYTVVKNAKSLEAPDNYVETTVQIGTNSIPGFYNEKTKYKLVGLRDTAGNVSLFIYDNNNYIKYDEIKSKALTIAVLDYPKVLKGYKETTIDIDGSKVKALVVKETSRFAIIYGMNVKNGTKAYYQYDLKSKTLSRYNDELIKSLQNKNKTYSYIIMGASVGCALFFMLTIILLVLNSKKKRLIKKLFVKEQPKPLIEKDVVKKSVKKNKEEIKENLEEQPKEEIKKEEPAKEEVKKDKTVVKEETEVYDIFADDNKKKKKSKN